ncbi:MarR family winged helix-turn-helix transcriptional regulator [Methylobacterium oryzae CBMB20]
MPADILDDLGPLFLGSRLKRLADRFQADAARILRDEGLGIQPAQFPLLAAIDRYGPLTIGDAAAALGVSQPAATRTAAGLVELGLLDEARSDADLRQKALTLSTAGRALMARAPRTLCGRASTGPSRACAPGCRVRCWIRSPRWSAGSRPSRSRPASARTARMPMPRRA